MVSTRLETGLLGDVLPGQSPISTVHYLEEWETEADMRRRVRSRTRFTSLLGRSWSPSRSRRTCSSTSSRPHAGLDYVAEIRAEHDVS